MARVDTLEHFLTDVADVIRYKTDTSDPITADSFDTAIMNIPTGTVVAPNYVSFNSAPNGTDISWLNHDTTYNLTSCRLMFSSAKMTGELDISDWDLSSCLDISAMFNYSYFSSIKFPGGTIPATQAENLIDSPPNLRSFKFGDNCSFPNLISARIMFKCGYNSALTSLDFNGASFPALTNFEAMFSGLTEITTITLPNTFTSPYISGIASMFSGCSSLVTINNLFPTAKTTQISSAKLSFSDIFSYCSNLTGTIDLSNITATANQLTRIFQNCAKVTEINLSNISTAANINATNAFYGCTSLQKLDIRSMYFYSVTGTNIFGDESDSTTCVPNNCEIIVMSDMEKNWFANNYPRFTNVKKVAEL